MTKIEQKFREACTKSGLGEMLKQLNNAALNSLVGATAQIMKETAGGNSVTGVIRRIGQTTNVSRTENAFNKRELVLDVSRVNPEDGKKYESYVAFNFTQKRCDELDAFNVGDKVEVSFTLGGREWNGKIINDIIGYRVERVGGAQTATAQAPAQAAPAPAPAPAQKPAAEPFPTQDNQDDLPF